MVERDFKQELVNISMTIHLADKYLIKDHLKHYQNIVADCHDQRTVWAIINLLTYTLGA